MPNTCPECGAIYADDLTCQSVFEEFLALEFTDPKYGAVHMLTIASYMIQHGRYTDEALIWIEARLRDYLEKGIAIEEIREQAGKGTDQAQRAWKVTRRPGDPPQAKIAWSLTIMDVVSKYQDAESYCESVKQWARATLQEMKPLVHPT
jgi:hypothetical protein